MTTLPPLALTEQGITHQHSKRGGRPFVIVDCGSMSVRVLESELFGHARGAVTGAVSARKGAFEEADGGPTRFTIFLNHVLCSPASTAADMMWVRCPRRF